MTVTTQQILDLLPIVADRGWRLTLGGKVRDDDGRCPVCALVNEIDPRIDEAVAAYWAFARVQGLDRADSALDEIVDAADNFIYREFRPALLRALGVSVSLRA